MIHRSIGTMLRLTVICMCWCTSAGAQVADTGKYILSETGFLAIIRNFHPYLELANLDVDLADAVVRQSRGSFDPTLASGSDRKTFDSKSYYNYYQTELVVPTWWGVEVYGGLNRVRGDYINPENTEGRSSYLGLSIPLGKDLVLDKRRAVLRRALLLKEQSRFEQQQAINDLLLEGLSAYWNWVRDYHLLQLIRQTIQVNEERYRYIQIEALQGSRPAIDTIEALAQLQQFRQQEYDAQLSFLNAGVLLSDYLWTGKEVSFAWNPSIVPDTSWLTENRWDDTLSSLDEILTQASLEHPKLRSFAQGYKVLELEKKLKFQELLPKLDLKYNVLYNGYNPAFRFTDALFTNNYKFGLDFKMPLLLREGRGGYQQSKIKLAQAGLKQDQLILEINNKIRAYYNELFYTRKQIQIYDDATLNYQKLLNAEDFRFKMGESTLFLLNAREMKVLEARQKLLQMKTKWIKNYISLLWSSGTLWK